MHAARIELPASPESAAAARAHVAASLHGTPREHDAVQVADEFIAETLRHGAAGIMVLTVERAPGRARVTLTAREEAHEPAGSAVSDELGMPYATPGRFPGLVIADALADRIGHRLDADGASALWAEFFWG